MFLFLYDHVLWSLAFALETVKDIMIDSSIKTWIIIFVKPVWSCPSDCTIFILFNDVKSWLVHLYSHAHVFSQVSFILLQLVYL